MPYFALKPMTLCGESIQPGQVVEIERALPEIKRQRIISKLLEQKRIVFMPEAQVLPVPKRRGRPPKVRQLQGA